MTSFSFLSPQLERNKKLVQQFEEQARKTRHLNEEVENMRAQLQQTQKALNSEVTRNTLPTVHDRCVQP